MWRDYLAAKIARNHRIVIILSGMLGAFLTVIVMCHTLSQDIEDNEFYRRKEGVVVITDPTGMRWEIEGLDEWLNPVIEQGKRMNKIEAMENHAQFPYLSDSPEDYVR